MTSWQKRARIGVALFGLVFAGVVYFAIGERQAVEAPRPLERLDPKAIFETTGAFLQRVRGTEQDFDIKAEKTFSYEDGSTKQVNVEITVRNREGRDFFITAREAQAGKDQVEMKLAGEVKLRASDGFELTTEAATFNQTDGIARVPGAAAFAKGRMTGSGHGMTYDQNTQILDIDTEAKVVTTDEGGNTVMDFAAGAATLDRAEHVLQLEGTMHALRGEQQIDSDTATALLNESNEIVTYIELRGNARVAGGQTSLEAMSARDIDLDYTDDGNVLERVTLAGNAAIAMAGQNGAAGRQMLGEKFELDLAPDGSVTRTAGRENVKLDLPAAEGTPSRSIRAKALDATGEQGQGLTSARFADEVEYREEAQRGSAPRVARSRALEIAMNGDAVTSAIFTGSVTFEEQGLKAGGAEVRYAPGAGTLQLTGTDAGGGPRVADDRITIEAQAIDVGLEGRRMAAKGSVKTTLRAGGTPQQGATKLPGLLKQGEAANVTADALDYQGASGSAVYTGNASLWQGETAIRASRITLDQEKGDLVAAGAARSTIVMDTGTSQGSAAEIQYSEGDRAITYGPGKVVAAPARGRGAAPPQTAPAPPPPGPAATPVAPPAAGGSVTPAPAATAAGRAAAPAPVLPVIPEARLTGPQGDLRAARIVVVLAAEGNRAERLEAYDNVSARVDTRLATGARLVYHAADERYEIEGLPGFPVKVVESCRETTGRTLTFFKSTDRIIVDGNKESRTQTKSGGPCPPAPPPR